MKKGVKQSDELNPLQNLISFRSTLVINQKSANPVFLKQLYDIPIIENKELTKLLKLKTPKSIFQKAAPKTKFSSDLLQLLASDDIKSPTDDLFNTIFCYQFFAWLYSGLIDKQEQNIEFFLKCLPKIISQPLQTVINYIFYKSLEFLIQTASFTYSDSMCNSINLIFQTNFSLDSSFYPLFVNVTKKLLAFHNHVSNTLNTINTMLLQDSSIFSVEDDSSLILLLQPYIQLLNPIALHILALIASKSKTVSQRLIDSFILITGSLVQSISFGEPPLYEIKPPPKDQIEEINIPGLSSLTQDLKFLPEFTFADSFKEPPYDLFNSAKPLSYFLSEKTKDFIRSISACFKNAHFEYKDTFSQMFVTHLKISASTNLSVFAELVSAFLTLFETFGSPHLFQDSILPSLFKTIIFHPSIHAFQPFQFDLAINTFRETILLFVHKYCPKGITTFLKELKTKLSNYQFLFIEMLGRLLNHSDWFSLHQIVNHTIYITLMDLMREFQLMNMNYPENETIKSARNTLYVFMSSLLIDPVIASSYLSTQAFVQGYFALIFEPSLTYNILHSTRDALSKMSAEFTTNKNYQNLINFIINTITICKKNSNSDTKYKQLAQDLSHEIATSLMHQSYLTLNFISILPEYLDYIIENPCREILSDMLNIFALYVASDNDFKLSIPLLKKLSSAIIVVEHDGISSHTENILFSILKKSLCCDCESLFLIVVPSILPLFISAYGSMSSSSSKMIRLLHSLCEFADYNKIMCQNGEVNYILIQYMCQKAKTRSNDVKINYHGYEFSLTFSSADIQNYVLPIFSMIANIKSENSEVAYLIDHLISYPDIEMCSFLMELVSKSRGIPNPVFSLGSDYVKFHVENCFASDFEGCGMTISFMLYMDAECLKESNALLSLISFTDANNQVFGISLDKTSLIARHENDSNRITVNLIKQIPQSQWTTIYISVVSGPELVQINNYLDHKKMNSSELAAIQFAPGELKIEIGGFDMDPNDTTVRNSFYLNSSRNWTKQQIAQIGDIKLFKGARNQEEIFQLYDIYNWKLNNSIDDPTLLFHSNLIKSLNNNATYSTPRKVGKPSGIHFAQSITDVVLNVHNSPPSFQSIVDILIKQNLCSKLVTYFDHLSDIDKIETENHLSNNPSFAGYSTMIINLIDELFRKSVDTQIAFTQSSVNLILRNLLHSTVPLTSGLYFAFYDVFQHISYSPLKKMIFELLLMNLYLWCKCDYYDFLEIINHYSHILITTCINMFQENFYFSSLLHQAMLIFSNDKNSLHLLNDKYDDEMICNCQEAFFVFLARIGTLALKESDVASLLGQLHGQPKMALINLLKLIFNISSTLLKSTTFSETCKPAISNLLESDDVDIIEHALVLIPECFDDNNMSFLISIGFKFLKSNHRTEIFERILKYIDLSPDMFIFESILAIGIKGDSIKKLSEALNAITEPNKHSSNEKSNLESMWFIFPLLTALHANNDESMTPICHYLIILLQTKISLRLYSSHCTAIFIFLSIIGTLTALPYKRVAVHLAKYLNKYSEPEQLSCIAINLFYFAIFRTNTKPGIVNEKENTEKKQSKYHKILTTAFKDSEFEECVNFVNDQSILTLPKSVNPNFVFTELSKLTLKSIMKPQFYLDLNNNKIDGNVYQLLNYANSLMNQSGKSPELNLVDYIIKVMCVKSTNSNEPQNEQNIMAAMALFEDIESAKSQYQKSLYQAIEIGQSKLAQIENDMNNYSKSETQPNGMDGIAEFQMKAEYKCHLDSIPSKIVEDNRAIIDQTLCSLLCPMKMKPMTPTSFRRIEPIEFTDVVIERPGTLLSLNKPPVSINFKLNKKAIGIFSNSKNRYINLSSIEYIFPSCNGTGCNFILNNGKSYLIDFKNDFSSMKKSLLSLKLPTCKSVLKSNCSQLAQNWINQKVSNFEFILQLNYFFGRSFKDKENYPIFPSLLTDFDDINSIRRDFSSSKNNGINFDENIQQSFNTNLSVKADYFFMPASIDYLPTNWAQSEFAVVFKLRKLLESSEITELLPFWIKLAFNYQINKSLIKDVDADKITIMHKFDIHGASSISNIVAATLIDTYNFLVLTSNGNACCVQIHRTNSTMMNMIDFVPVYKDSPNVKTIHNSLPMLATISTPFRAFSMVSFDDFAITDDLNLPSSMASASLSSLNSNLVNDSSNQGMISSGRCISFSETGSDSIKSVTSLTSISANDINHKNNFRAYSTSIASLSNRYASCLPTNAISQLIYSPNSGSNHAYCSYQNSYYAFSNKRIVLYSPDDNKAYLISNTKLIMSAIIFPEIPIIGCYNNDLYYLSDPCTVTCISESKISKPFAYTTSRITVMSTSETFHVLIIGTQDGFIHIYKEPQGELIKTISLQNELENDDYEIRRILITPTWGLILVQTEGILTVFDINGTFVHSIKFTEPILNWYGFTDFHSFDYVVFENQQHKIGFFDPINENSVQYFYEAMERTPLITFDPLTNCFIFLSENKQITFVPKPC